MKREKIRGKEERKEGGVQMMLKGRAAADEHSRRGGGESRHMQRRRWETEREGDYDRNRKFKGGRRMEMEI